MLPVVYCSVESETSAQLMMNALSLVYGGFKVEMVGVKVMMN